MIVSIEFPETTPIRRFDQRYLKQALVATLYNMGELSEREACETLGLSRRKFEDLLPEFGFSVLSDQPDNVQIELNA